MVVVHVRVHVRADSIEAFRSATVANASASRTEPGVARFDVLQLTAGRIEKELSEPIGGVCRLHGP